MSLELAGKPKAFRKSRRQSRSGCRQESIVHHRRMACSACGYFASCVQTSGLRLVGGDAGVHAVGMACRRGGDAEANHGAALLVWGSRAGARGCGVGVSGSDLGIP